MKTQNATWDDVKRFADEVQVKIHLASLEARDRWRAIEPRIGELEKKLSKASERTSKVVTEEIETLSKALRNLRDEVIKH